MKHSARVALASLCMLLNIGCGGSGSSFFQNPSPPPSTGNQWTWVSGSNLANQQGSYGQQGIPASSNAPPARYGAATWTDAAGNLWLFGGITAPTSSSDTYFNDLWKFSGGQWTWVSGSNIPNARGVYGTLGVPAAPNIPGGRSNAVSWTDSSGNFWLFGGVGLDANGRSEDLNDLWRYGNGQWTWMGGPQTTIAGTPGIYGTKGIAGAENIPGGRTESMGWTDTAGNFWLFGGLGEDSVGNWGYLSDLWKYSNDQWTWVGGTNIVQQAGVYGTMGVPASANTPGGRTDSATWVDASGNLWLFGGSYNQPLGTLHGLMTSGSTATVSGPGWEGLTSPINPPFTVHSALRRQQTTPESAQAHPHGLMVPVISGSSAVAEHGPMISGNTATDNGPGSEVHRRTRPEPTELSVVLRSPTSPVHACGPPRGLTTQAIRGSSVA